LIDIGDRVRIIDRVHYAVPFGVIGRIMHAFFIRKTLERIFDFRREKLNEILSKKARD
jgi:ligand-binding SRPBCC domain-containing protein